MKNVKKENLNVLLKIFQDKKEKLLKVKKLRIKQNLKNNNNNLFLLLKEYLVQIIKLLLIEESLLLNF